MRGAHSRQVRLCATRTGVPCWPRRVYAAAQSHVRAESPANYRQRAHAATSWLAGTPCSGDDEGCASSRNNTNDTSFLRRRQMHHFLPDSEGHEKAQQTGSVSEGMQESPATHQILNNRCSPAQEALSPATHQPEIPPTREPTRLPRVEKVSPAFIGMEPRASHKTSFLVTPATKR